MDDLISRAAAIECAIDAVDDWDGGWNPNRETVIRKYFEEVPAVDAAPVMHGRWTYFNCVGTGRYQCSECLHWVDAGTDRNYCPNCGADMRGDNYEK